MTQEEIFIIEWADELIRVSDYSGKIDKYCFGFAWNFTDVRERTVKQKKIEEFRQQVTGSVPLEPNPQSRITRIVKRLEHYLDEVKEFLLDNGYISIPDANGKFEWFLSEKGRLVKELGGHEKYKKFRKRELNVLHSQFLINIGLIVATILAALVPLLIWLIDSCNKKHGQ